MGIDTCVYVKKTQFKKLIEDDFDGFLFLIQQTNCRWSRFIDQFDDVFDVFVTQNMNEVYTSKDMIKLVTLTERLSYDEKDMWIDLLLEYDLIFQPDTKETPQGYIDLWAFYFKMLEFVKKNLEAIKNAIRDEEKGN